MIQDRNSPERKRAHDARNYHRTEMQKEIIIKKLKERGCRITNQRLVLLDIILENECSRCKEIYYKASRVNRRIGTATVYRMLGILEEIGAISRKNMYNIVYFNDCDGEDTCKVELDDNTVQYLSGKKWNEVIEAGLKECGYINKQQIREVTLRQCESD